MKIQATFLGRDHSGIYRWELTRGGERIGFYVCPKWAFWNGVRLPNVYL